MDKFAALALADDIRASYAGRNVSDDHVKRWAEVLVVLDDAEATKAVELVTARSIDPPSKAQLRQVVEEVHKKTMSQEWSTWDCVFMDGVVCPNCSRAGEEIVHGHLLEPEEVQRRIHALRVEMFGAAP